MRLFQRVNALSNLEIKPSGVAKLNVAGDKAIMTFGPDVFAGGGGPDTDTDPQIHIGPLTTEGVYPTPAEMTTAIEAAIFENDPKAGDYVALTRGDPAIPAFYFRLIVSDKSDAGLFLRVVTEGASTFRAMGWQTGVYE